MVDEVDYRGGVAALEVAAFVPAVGAQAARASLLGQSDFDDVVFAFVALNALAVFVGCFFALMLRDAIRGTGRAVTRAAQRDPARASSASASPSPAAPGAPQGAVAEAQLAERAIGAVAVVSKHGLVRMNDLFAACRDWQQWATNKGDIGEQAPLTEEAVVSVAVRLLGASKIGKRDPQGNEQYSGLRLRRVWEDRLRNSATDGGVSTAKRPPSGTDAAELAKRELARWQNER